jgi:hypothetical protein
MWSIRLHFVHGRIVSHRGRRQIRSGDPERQRDAAQRRRSLREIERLLKANGMQIFGRIPMFVLMNAPIDSPNSNLRAYWNGLHKLVARSEMLGWIAGSALYPLGARLDSRTARGAVD